MVRNGFARSKALIVTYSVVSFIFYPLMFLLGLVLNGGQSISSYSLIFLAVSTPTYLVYYPMVAIMPLVIAAIIWGYLFSKPAVDVFHAMPIKKSKLYAANYLAGLLIYSIPIILCSVLAAVIYMLWYPTASFADGAATVSQAEMVATMFKQMAAVLYTGIGLYSLACLVAVSTGTAFDFVLYTIGLSAASPMLLFISQIFGEGFLYGYYSNSDYAEIMGKIFPTAHMIMALADIDGVNWIGWGLGYLAVSAVLVAVGILLYNRRKSEHSGKTYTGSLVSHIVKGLISFIMGAFLGLSLYTIDENLFWFYFGLVLGSVISYFVIETIVSRGLKTLPKRILPCSIIVLVLLIFSSCYTMDFFRFEKFVPDISDISVVSLNYKTEDSTVSEVKYMEPEAIQAIVDLQSQAVEREKTDVFQDDFYDPENSEYYYYQKYNSLFSPEIIYTLKNGRTVKRRYQQKFTYEEVANLALLLDTESYKKANDNFADINYNQIASLYIYDKTQGTSAALNYNSRQLCELLNAMSEDMEKMSFKERYAPDKPQVAVINLQKAYSPDYSGTTVASKDYNFVVYQDSKTYKLLQQYTKSEVYSVDYEGIVSVDLVRTDSNRITYQESQLVYNNVYSEFTPNITLNDPDLIKQAIDSAYLYYGKEYLTGEENGYLVRINYGAVSNEDKESYISYGEEKTAAGESFYAESSIKGSANCLFIPYEKLPQSIRSLLK